MKTKIKLFALTAFCLCSQNLAAQSQDSTSIGSKIEYVEHEDLFIPNENPPAEPEQDEVHHEDLYTPKDPAEQGQDPEQESEGDEVHHKPYYTPAPSAGSNPGACGATTATFNFTDCRGYRTKVTREVGSAENGQYGYFKFYSCSQYIDEGEQSFLCNNGTWEKTDYMYCKTPEAKCR